MPLNRKIALTALCSLLFASCSHNNPRVVTTRDGKTIKFKRIALVEKGWLSDSESGSFEMQTTVGTVKVPRDFKGIRSFEILQIGLSLREIEEQDEEVSRAKVDLQIDSSPHMRGESAAEIKNRKQAAEQSYKKFIERISHTGSAYRFRITYDSGVVVEGEIKPIEIPGWGYLKGRTEVAGSIEGDMQLPLSNVLTITRE